MQQNRDEESSRVRQNRRRKFKIIVLGEVRVDLFKIMSIAPPALLDELKRHGGARSNEEGFGKQRDAITRWVQRSLDRDTEQDADITDDGLRKREETERTDNVGAGEGFDTGGK